MKQYRPALGQPCHRPAVVFLIQEKSGFLPVYKVHPVADAVFHNIRPCEIGLGFSGQGEPALALCQPLLFPQGYIVAQVDAGNVLPVPAQHPDDDGQQSLPDTLHAQTQHLGHQYRAEAVHCQPRKAVRLPEDHPAAVQILRLHHALAVVPGILYPALPEGVVKPVVGIAGEEAAADERVAVIKARAEIGPLVADDIRQAAVLHRAGELRHLPGIYPRVPRRQGTLSFLGDMHLGIGSFCLHSPACLSKKNRFNYSTYPGASPYKHINRRRNSDYG